MQHVHQLPCLKNEGNCFVKKLGNFFRPRNLRIGANFFSPKKSSVINCSLSCRTCAHTINNKWLICTFFNGPIVTQSSGKIRFKWLTSIWVLMTSTQSNSPNVSLQSNSEMVRSCGYIDWGPSGDEPLWWLICVFPNPEREFLCFHHKKLVL